MKNSTDSTSACVMTDWPEEKARKYYTAPRLMTLLITILTITTISASSHTTQQKYQYRGDTKHRHLLKTTYKAGYESDINQYHALRPISRKVTKKRTLVGPNVCGKSCCRGWDSGNTLLCITPVCRPNCANGGRCVRPNVCFCKSAYHGKFCEGRTSRKIMLDDYRKRDPRQTVVHVRYKEPYRSKTPLGQRVKVVCNPTTCFNGGTCVDGSCICREGYTGSRCEKVIVVKTTLVSALPGADVARSTSTEVALKLCKALCVHGTCRSGSGAICRCYPGYYGAMCDSSYAISDNKFPENSALSGLKYNNNFLRPVVSYSNQQTRRIPTLKYISAKTLSTRSKLGKCYKIYNGVSCGLSFNAIMTMETCCSEGLGDAWGWGLECNSCESGIGSRVLPSTSLTGERPPAQNNCPEGFRLFNGGCHDINECLMRSDICANGKCNNIRGSYWCQCDTGHHQHISKKYCLPDVTRFRNVIGRSYDRCYLSLDKNGYCTRSVSTARGSKAVCCCSIGVAWGTACEKCPRRGSDAYRRLCPRGSGYYKTSISPSTSSSASRSVPISTRPHFVTPIPPVHNSTTLPPTNTTEQITTAIVSSPFTSVTSRVILTTRRHPISVVDNNPTQQPTYESDISKAADDDDDTADRKSTERASIKQTTHNVALNSFTESTRSTDTKPKKLPTFTNADKAIVNTDRQTTTDSSSVLPTSSDRSSPQPYVQSAATKKTKTYEATDNNANEVGADPLTPIRGNMSLIKAYSSQSATAPKRTKPNQESSTAGQIHENAKPPSPTNAQIHSSSPATTSQAHVESFHAGAKTDIRDHDDASKQLPAAQPTESDEHNEYIDDIEDSFVIDQYEIPFDELDEDKLFSEIENSILSPDEQEYPTTMEATTANTAAATKKSTGANGEDIGFDSAGKEYFATSEEKHTQSANVPPLISPGDSLTTLDHLNSHNVVYQRVSVSYIESAEEQYDKGRDRKDKLPVPTTTAIPLVNLPVNAACASAPCLHGGECEDVHDESSFKCHCVEGYFGILCETKDYCVPDPCLNGATCEAGIGFYYCDCQERYMGRNCEEKRSACDSKPCVHGTCSNANDGYACGCEPGYQGKTCGEDINECSHVSSCDGGRCLNTDGSYYCDCFDGYASGLDGTKCEEVNECELVECGGTATCRNLPGSYICECLGDNEEYDDQKSECISLHIEEPIIRKPCYSTPYSCRNVLSPNITKEECCCTIGQSWGDCRSRQLCPMRREDFESICSAGRGLVYDKNRVTKDLNECLFFGDAKVCGSGRCVNSFGGYECVCFPGFYYNGRIQACDDINECRMRNKCVNGRCLNLHGSYKCQCDPGSVLRYNGFVSTCTKPSSGRFPYRPALNEADKKPTKNTVFKDTCYSRILRKHMCAGELPIRYSYQLCCCSIGVAWGSSCSKCPDRGTDDHKFLCKSEINPIKIPSSENPGVPEAFHEQECGLAGECEHGRCLRTENGYTCECNKGYMLDADLVTCLDVNECEELGETSRLCFNSVCVNEPGSFRCFCHEGFQTSPDDSTICSPVPTNTDVFGDTAKNITRFS